MVCHFLTLGYKGHCCSPLLPSPPLPSSTLSSCSGSCSGGCQLYNAKSSYGQAHMATNWGVHLTASEGLRLSNDHRSEFTCVLWAFSWLQPQSIAWLLPHDTPWARTTHLSCSLTPDPQKSWTINVYCFKHLNWGIICNTATYNCNTEGKWKHGPMGLLHQIFEHL